jgi:hypothetical protein
MLRECILETFKDLFFTHTINLGDQIYSPFALDRHHAPEVIELSLTRLPCEVYSY